MSGQVTLEGGVASQLAADILRDHFGGIAARVGATLLDRGPLTLQDVLRFAGGRGEIGGGEPLKYTQVRNVLLTFVQHGVVTTKPHPQAANNEALRGMLQVYTLDLDSVLARLRYPHFLEHVVYTYGEQAYELLFLALRYGRVRASTAIAEVQMYLKGAVTKEELQDALKLLVTERVLVAAEPLGPATAPAAESDAAAPSAEAQIVAVSKDAPEDATSIVAAPQEGGAERPAKRAKADEGGASGFIDSVYRANRPILDLSVCKNLLCRLMEEKVNGHAAQVVKALLTAVAPGEPGCSPPMKYLKFKEIEERMRQIGAHQAGRDPGKELPKIRKMLDLLGHHKDSLVKKRTVTVHPSERRRLAQAANMSGPSSAIVHADPEQVPEWAVDWSSARRMLVNAATSQLIRNQFGPKGLRIFNLLIDRDPPQRLEERDIFNTCMVPIEEGREVLNEMVRMSVVHWQEIPRKEGLPLAGSFWLYYVDQRRVELAMVWLALQAVLNLRVRFRTESAKVVPLETRADSLTAAERQALKKGRRVEDILERSFLVLDAALLVFRCF